MAKSIKTDKIISFLRINPIEKICKDIQGLSRKSPDIVNITRMICVTSMQPAAKESGLERAHVNDDDFTALVSGGSRCR